MTMATVTGIPSQQQQKSATKPADPKVLSFMSTFDKILEDLLEIFVKFNVPEQGINWFKEMFQVNCVGGKMNRGLTVPSALQSIKGRDLTDKELFDSQVLGWLIEMVTRLIAASILFNPR